MSGRPTRTGKAPGAPLKPTGCSAATTGTNQPRTDDKKHHEVPAPADAASGRASKGCRGPATKSHAHPWAPTPQRSLPQPTLRKQRARPRCYGGVLSIPRNRRDFFVRILRFSDLERYPRRSRVLSWLLRRLGAGVGQFVGDRALHAQSGVPPLTVVRIDPGRDPGEGGRLGSEGFPGA